MSTSPIQNKAPNSPSEVNSPSSTTILTKTTNSSVILSSDIDPEATEINSILELRQIDQDSLDDIENIFLWINLGIAALFFLEIVLKCITLRLSFIKKPLQVFDVFVVLLCLAFQATFRAVSLPEVTYFISYVIVLRLWRICYMCNRMKVNNRIRNGLRTKCIQLEDIAKQQMDRIEELKEKETSFHYETNELTLKYNPIYQEPGKHDDVIHNNNTLSSSAEGIKGTYFEHRDEISVETRPDDQSEDNDAPDGMHTTRMVDINELDPTSNVAKMERSQPEICSPEGGSPKSGSLKSSSPKSGSPKSGSPKRVSPKSVSPLSDSPKRSSPNSDRPKSGVETRNVKARWRRSSTSQFVDMKMSLHSPTDIDFPQPRLQPVSSCSDLLNHDLHLENIVSEEPKQEESGKDVGYVNEEKSLENSKDFEIVDDEDEFTQKKYKFRRQNSCPDYVFANRMKLSTYESMLIEADERMNPASAFNNEAYLGDTADEDDPLDALSNLGETYRSQIGMPTTEL